MISVRTLLALALSAAILVTQPAAAQWPFGNRQPAPQPHEVPGESDLSIRVGRLEAQLRGLTGQIEQLQYQNQQLQQQLQALQGGTNPVQQRPAPRPQQQSVTPPLQQQQVLPPVQQTPPKSGDAFDPNSDPNAPGSPRNLGQVPGKQQAPQGPLVLSPNQNQNNDLPPQQQQIPAPAPQPQAVLPPSNSPKDAYDLAYGYVLRRDYALAEQSFRAFLSQYPSDRNVPLANYWRRTDLS